MRVPESAQILANVRPRNVFFGPSLGLGDTILKYFQGPRPFLDPTVASRGLLGKKKCELQTIREKSAVHFGCHFDLRVDKSHQKPKKVGDRKTSRNKMDFRLLPKWPNVAPTP